MLMMAVDRKVSTRNSLGVGVGCEPNSFEGRFLSIAGSQLLVESEHDDNPLYALATDAMFTCDGEICKVESLKVGRRVRVTTHKSDPNMVVHIECFVRAWTT